MVSVSLSVFVCLSVYLTLSSFSQLLQQDSCMYGASALCDIGCVRAEQLSDQVNACFSCATCTVYKVGSPEMCVCILSFPSITYIQFSSHLQCVSQPVFQGPCVSLCPAESVNLDLSVFLPLSQSLQYRMSDGKSITTSLLPQYESSH